MPVLSVRRINSLTQLIFSYKQASEQITHSTLVALIRSYYMNEYGTNQYWDDRYITQKGNTFDWLLEYDQLKSIFHKYCKFINRQSKILNVGCGNGIVTEQMFDDGYRNITNIDISQQVIQQMQERNKNRHPMAYLFMDAQYMSFNDQCFDAIFDKCTIDGIMTSEWYLLTTHQVISQVFRTLKTGGIYVVVSFACSTLRRYLFQRKSFDFSISEQCITKDGKPYYIYLCVKNSPLTTKMKEANIEVIEQITKQLEQENNDRKNKIAFEVDLVKPQTNTHSSYHKNLQSAKFVPFDPFE